MSQIDRIFGSRRNVDDVEFTLSAVSELQAKGTFICWNCGSAENVTRSGSLQPLNGAPTVTSCLSAFTSERNHKCKMCKAQSLVAFDMCAMPSILNIETTLGNRIDNDYGLASNFELELSFEMCGVWFDLASIVFSKTSPHTRIG